MEIIERILGIKRGKQKELLVQLGINGKSRKELIGPEYEDAEVVEVDNDQFLKMLQGNKPEQVLRHIVQQSDTHQYFELYIDVGQGVKIKTGVALIDYSGERTLLADLHEMSYEYESIQPKNSGSVFGWGVYKHENER